MDALRSALQQHIAIIHIPALVNMFVFDELDAPSEGLGLAVPKSQ